MNHYFADQVARQLHGILGEFRATEAPKAAKGNRLAYVFHFSGWSSPSMVGISSETVG